MEEPISVKWIVIISFIMFFVSLLYGPVIFAWPSSAYPTSRDLWYYINRVDVILFLATITTGALFSARFGKKETMYKLTLYMFIVSMGLFFLGLVRTLFL